MTKKGFTFVTTSIILVFTVGFGFNAATWRDSSDTKRKTNELKTEFGNKIHDVEVTLEMHLSSSQERAKASIKHDQMIAEQLTRIETKIDSVRSTE